MMMMKLSFSNYCFLCGWGLERRNSLIQKPEKFIQIGSDSEVAICFGHIYYFNIFLKIKDLLVGEESGKGGSMLYFYMPCKTSMFSLFLCMYLCL